MMGRMQLRPGFSDDEWFEWWEYRRWKLALPWTRWLINRWRRQEGKAPFH